MATLDESDFSTSDGWTEITTTGTLTFNQTFNGKTCLQIDAASNSWDTLGVYRTDGQTGAIGHTMYWSMWYPGGGNDFMCGYNSAASIALFGGTFKGIYQSGSGGSLNIYPDGPNGINALSGATRWFRMRAEIKAGGTVNFKWAEDGSETFTDLGDSATALPALIGGTARFCANLFNNTIVNYIADWIYTDDGNPTVPEVEEDDAMNVGTRVKFLNRTGRLRFPSRGGR